MGDTQANPKEERVALMISAEELAAIDDFRFANRFRSRAEAIRHLCRAGIAGTPVEPAPAAKPATAPGGLRWVEDGQANGVEAWSGREWIGFVVKISGKDEYAWKLTDLAGSRHRPAIMGRCGSLAGGKAALRKAWRRWCADRGLVEAPAAGEGA